MPRTPVGDRVRLFGIRHHGPGSARSLVAALEEWQPDVLLIEGPNEAQPLVPHLLDEELKPPVAMLLYAVDTPKWAAYYPLAEFSPELQACRWAARYSCPVTFMDLPASAMLGMSVARSGRSEAMELVATAAGFDDTEDWWEHIVERRQDSRELFAGIEALMCAVREAETNSEDEGLDSEADGRRQVSDADFEAMREAYMRQTLRESLAGRGKVAVVCGAWHVPALRELPTAREDEALLKGLPKLKVGATVVPWTFDRLTLASGYGAGVQSPRFYDLLWNTRAEEVPTKWLLLVARLMREEDLDASPASVIEAVRLADALSSLRGRTRPGLRELCEAASSVLVQDEAIWQLVARRLIVGDELGQVPDTVPKLPLQSDLEALQKRLRMKVDDTDRKLELDQRGDMDIERSHLLHRLQLLDVPWGIEERVAGKTGTFHEHWRLRWHPELVIAVIEAAIYGNTVASAANNRAVTLAGEAKGLAEVALLVERVLTADLPDAVEPTVAKLQELSATGADVAELAGALPPLAAIMRYGTVRKTDVEQVAPVLDAIFTRLCVGLPSACVSLDDDAAGAMMRRLGEITQVIQLVDDREKQATWLDTLASIAGIKAGHPLVVGKAERIRFDLGAVTGEWLGQRLNQEASAGASALETAAFVEGLLDGHGTVLLHQEPLLRAVDEWICGLGKDVFDEILPLIRRTFALFTKPERRQIGERVSGGLAVSVIQSEINEERASRVLPIVRQILGLPNE